MHAPFSPPHLSTGRGRPDLRAMRFVGRAFCCLGWLVLMAAAGGCDRVEHTLPVDDGFAVTLATDPAPPTVGEAIVILSLRDGEGAPVSDAHLVVEANMSHAGMIPSIGEAGSGPGGVYRVPIEWTMAGDWQVDAVFTMPDGRLAARTYPVQVK